jgi:hypothetical protein
MPALLNTAVVSDRRVRFTPVARACEQPPGKNDVLARWTPTSEEEQAVSMLTLGPFSPKEKEIRPLATDKVPLVAVKAVMPW